MASVAEIKQSIAALSATDARELATWLDEHLQLLASSEGLFQMYDEEETSCQSRVAEKSG